MDQRIFPFLICALLLLSACEHPFFLTKVDPAGGPSTADPRDVIALLQESYELQDLRLFRSLIYSQEEFSSYVAPQGRNPFPFGLERIDYDSTIFPYHLIPGEHRYVSLSFAHEQQVHANLFRSATSIEFRPALTVSTVDYWVVDGDTLMAVLRTDDTRLRVTAPEIQRVYGWPSWEFHTAGQYFLVKKDRNSNWKIWKWIETRER